MTGAVRWSWWAGFLLVTGVALYLTVIAYHENLPAFFNVKNVDKVAHFTIAGLLAFFLDGALGGRDLRALRVPLAAVIVLVPVGIEEYLQRYSISRTSSIWDYAADVAGVVVLVPLSRWLRST